MKLESKLKVLHIEAGKHLYGGALQVTYLIKALNKFSVQSYLACPHHAEIATVIGDHAQVLPITMSGDVDIRLTWRLMKIIKQHQFDLVHIHSRRGADVFGLIAAKLMRVPVIISRRVDNTEPSWFAKAKYHACDKVITISEGIRQVLVSQGVNSSHVVAVRSAVDTFKFHPTANRPWFLKQFGLTDDTLVIGVLAQLIERKGHRVLFDALPDVINQTPDLKVLIFGKGPLDAALKQRVIDKGLQGYVQFCGFRDDMAQVLPNLDIVAHPAYTEGLGVSLLQASSCGVPIVASAVGGIPEIVKDSENGFLVPQKNAKALSHALLKLTNNVELRQQLGQRGRNMALADFSIDVMAKGNYDIYQHCLKSI